MRFAFCGFDRWRGVFDAFVEAAWTPVKIFTVPVDNVHDHNNEIADCAARHRVPLQMSRLTPHDLQELRQLGCDTLVVSGYAWRIPDWTPHLRHAINFHPAPLPDGRGPYPLMQALLEARREWGLACHRIAPEFDAGDVLDDERFPLADDECLDTLQLRLQIAARNVASRVARDFPVLWQHARPQQGGSYWRRLGDAQRTIDFTRPVADIMRLVRAYGTFECLAVVNQKPLHVRRAAAWVESHAYTPGQLVHSYRRSLVFAARDGFVSLLEWNYLNANARARMLA